jgi:hypothetical protein
MDAIQQRFSRAPLPGKYTTVIAYYSRIKAVFTVWLFATRRDESILTAFRKQFGASTLL